jgi:hypothetical protein
MSPVTQRISGRAGLPWVVTLLAAGSVLLAACGTGGAQSGSQAPSNEASAAGSTAASPSDPAPSETASEVAGGSLCLRADVIAAIEDLADGNLEPEVPLADIADAVEALDVSSLDVPFAENDRDDLVANLRTSDANTALRLPFAAAVFRSDIMPEIDAC